MNKERKYLTNSKPFRVPRKCFEFFRIEFMVIFMVQLWYCNCEPFLGWLRDSYHTPKKNERSNRPHPRKQENVVRDQNIEFRIKENSVTYRMCTPFWDTFWNRVDMDCQMLMYQPICCSVFVRGIIASLFPLQMIPNKLLYSDGDGGVHSEYMKKMKKRRRKIPTSATIKLPSELTLREIKSDGIWNKKSAKKYF